MRTRFRKPLLHPPTRCSPGATGLEPATYGVTGRYGPNRHGVRRSSTPARVADDASNKQRGTDDEPWEWCWGRVYGRDGTHLI
jgi:hypothetical protein